MQRILRYALDPGFISAKLYAHSMAFKYNRMARKINIEEKLLDEKQKSLDEIKMYKAVIIDGNEKYNNIIQQNSLITDQIHASTLPFAFSSSPSSSTSLYVNVYGLQQANIHIKNQSHHISWERLKEADKINYKRLHYCKTHGAYSYFYTKSDDEHSKFLDSIYDSIERSREVKADSKMDVGAAISLFMMAVFVFGNIC